MTEQRRDEAALRDSERRHRQLANELAETDRRKDEFLAVLGHELRNPIAPIYNLVQVLKRQREPTAATVARSMEVMERQLAHLTHIVDDLLDVARITSGRLTLQKDRVDLADVARQAVEAAQPFLDARHHALSVVLPDEPSWVIGDRARLVQVVVNLLSNAAKFTNEGGRVELRLGREGEEAVLVVADNGTGIPADFLPHVFEMFRQGVRPSQGLGIGLSLARQIVELHAGRIEAASPGPGRGSTFTVRLPLAGAAGSKHEPPRGVEDERARQRLLVVEDNPDVAASFAEFLELLGHDVRMARDGPEALEVAAAFEPSLAFVDIGLPGMDGHEVARRLRERYGWRVRLVAVTGYGQQSDRDRASRSGFDEFMVKPPDMDAVEEVLARLVSSAERPRA